MHEEPLGLIKNLLVLSRVPATATAATINISLYVCMYKIYLDQNDLNLGVS